MKGSTREPAFPAKDRSFKNKILLWSDPPYHQRLNLAPSGDLGHSNSEEIINSPDKNVNRVHKSGLILLNGQKIIHNTLCGRCSD
jgi:hypothetical protein